MKHTVTALTLGIATAVIIGYTFISLLGFEKRQHDMVATSMYTGTSSAEMATSTDKSEEALAALTSYVVPKVSYTPYGDGLVYTGQSELEIDVRPYDSRIMKLSLVSGSEYGAPKSELDGGKVWVNREKGEISFVNSDSEEAFAKDEPYSSRVLFTIHKKEAADDIGAALRKIRLIGADTETTSDVWQFCTAARNEEIKDKEVYWLVENDQFQLLPEEERLAKGPTLCGAGRYFVFGEHIFVAHRYADGVQVEDIGLVK